MNVHNKNNLVEELDDCQFTKPNTTSHSSRSTKAIRRQSNPNKQPRGLEFAFCGLSKDCKSLIFLAYLQKLILE